MFISCISLWQISKEILRWIRRMFNIHALWGSSAICGNLYSIVNSLRGPCHHQSCVPPAQCWADHLPNWPGALRTPWPCSIILLSKEKNRFYGWMPNFNGPYTDQTQGLIWSSAQILIPGRTSRSLASSLSGINLSFSPFSVSSEALPFLPDNKQPNLSLKFS